MCSSVQTVVKNYNKNIANRQSSIGFYIKIYHIKNSSISLKCWTILRWSGIMSLLVGVTLQSFIRFQHFGWILIPRIWMCWICMRRWRAWIFDFSGSAQEWGLGRKRGRDKLCLAVNSPTGFGIFNYFSTVSSGDDWIVHQIGLGQIKISTIRLMWYVLAYPIQSMTLYFLCQRITIWLWWSGYITL